MLRSFTNRIGASSLNLMPADFASNKKLILNVIKESKKKKITFLCLPELSITGYGCEDLFYSKTFVQEALKILAEIKEQTDNIFVTIGLPIKYENNLYNAIAIVFNKKILGFYCKKELANKGLYYETRWFKAWEAGKITTFKPYNTEVLLGDIVINIPVRVNELHSNIKVGFELCEDAWVHDNVRTTVLQSQKGEFFDIIFNPSASHFQQDKYSTRKKLVVESSKKLNTTYVYANHLGNEAGQIIYDGDTYIANYGKMIAQGERFSFHPYELCYADIEFINNNCQDAIFEEVNVQEPNKEFEFLNATILGLYDYLRKSKNRGFVLSLSGGADSLLCAVLVAEMIKKALNQLGAVNFLQSIGVEKDFQINELDNLSLQNQAKYLTRKLLTTVYQASINNSKQTFLSAQELSNEIGANFLNWEIDDICSEYIRLVEESSHVNLNHKNDDVALQNIQARVRVPGIWLIANIKKYLLLTTSNRSEGSVGYCTMDGDTAGSLAPIAGIDKDFIKYWLQWAEKKLNYQMLKHVNSLQPSAELRPRNDKNSNVTQTDENDLMPYSLLQKIESLAIKEWKDPIEIFNIIWNTYIEKRADLKLELITSIIKFFSLWKNNQWKRNRSAPSLYIGEYGINPSNYLRFPVFCNWYEKELKELKLMIPK